VGLRLWGAMGVILLGAVCYCIQDFNPSIEGYTWLAINLVAAAGYHVYVKWAIGAVGLSTMDMVIYNNLLSLPLLLLSGLVFDNAGELPGVISSMGFGDWLMVALSSLVAACISYTGFGLQAAVSATSATVVNHINKVTAFVASFLVFHDRFTPFSLAGLIITIVGGVWYSKEQMDAKKNAAPTEEKKPPSENTTLLEDGKAEAPASSSAS